MAKANYTTNEAASILGVTSARVRQMVLNKKLKAEKFGTDWMISASDLESAKQRKTSPGPDPRQERPSKVRKGSSQRRGNPKASASSKKR